MPITQDRMIAQMKAARAAHEAFIQFREQLFNIISGAKVRYYKNEELHQVLDAIESTMKLTPTPDDRVTFINEAHYRREAKRNDTLREKQEVARRMAGVPTIDEALAVLNARNVLRRAGLPTDTETYEPAPMTYEEFNKGPKKRTMHGGVAIKYPRDDPNDKELEFDTQADLEPFANLPAPADAKDLETGLDLGAELPDDNGPSNLELPNEKKTSDI